WRQVMDQVNWVALSIFAVLFAITGILSASSAKAVRRNAALLPGYAVMLGLLTLLGFFAIAPNGCRSSSSSAHWCSSCGCRPSLRFICNYWAASGSFQTLPSLLLGAFTRWFNDWALLLGWAVGIVTGTVMVVAVHFSPIYPLSLWGFSIP